LPLWGSSMRSKPRLRTGRHEQVGAERRRHVIGAERLRRALFLFHPGLLEKAVLLGPNQQRFDLAHVDVEPGSARGERERLRGVRRAHEREDLALEHGEHERPFARLVDEARGVARLHHELDVWLEPRGGHREAHANRALGRAEVLDADALCFGPCRPR